MNVSETENLLRLFVVALAKDGKGDGEGPTIPNQPAEN